MQVSSEGAQSGGADSRSISIPGPKSEFVEDGVFYFSAARSPVFRGLCGASFATEQISWHVTFYTVEMLLTFQPLVSVTRLKELLMSAQMPISSQPYEP